MDIHQNVSKTLKYILYFTILMSLVFTSGCNGSATNSSASTWPTSTPEKQGMDSNQLIKMLDSIASGTGANLHSLLVLRHGVLVMEVYWPPFGPQDKHQLFSATKSVTSGLVGIAISEGKIKRIDQPVLDYFPDTNIALGDEDKKNIHIVDLLNMTSGLTADDAGMGDSQDWAKYTLNQAINNKPGSMFDYNTGNTQLLSAILQKATGKTEREYAAEKLFTPLGITDFVWDADPSGVTEGGTGLMLTPRDMLKYGYLYLQNGQWQGHQVVPADWVKNSTQITTGYKYLWWGTSNGYSAGGYGNQIIYMVPSKDLVVVSTAGMNADPPLSWNLTDDYIVQSVKSDGAIPDNPASQQLAERINKIAHPTAQAIPAAPSTQSKINGKTYKLNDNDLGWKTVALSFDKQQAWLSFTTKSDSNEQKFPIGLDGNYRLTSQKAVAKTPQNIQNLRNFYNPYGYSFALGMPYDGVIGMKGQWLADQIFNLTIQDSRYFDQYSLKINLTDQNISFTWYSAMGSTLMMMGKPE